jgi:Domain of unknown function (DUF222)
MDLASTASALAAVDLDRADRHEVTEALRLATRLIRMAHAVEIEADLRLVALAEADPTISPEHLDAAATGRSPAKATAAIRRATAAQSLPRLRALLAAGIVGVEHLDAFATAVRSLRSGLRTRLIEQEEQLARFAAHMTAEEFRARLDAAVRDIEGDDGVDRLQRQRRHIGARTWTGRDGMWNIHGRFDAERAVSLIEALRRATEARFHAEHPGETPDDPLLRHEFFQALGLADLMLGAAGGSGRPEFIITIDEETLRHGRHHASRVDCGRGVHLPIETLRSMAGRARFVPVVVDRHGVVIRQGRPVPTLDQLRESLLRPVSLDHGRSRRYASRDQRRALRAMYRSCGIPGCDRHVADCQPHHLEHWEHGGPTDLALLLPLCKHHHDRLHAESWEVELRRDRSLIVRRHGEVIMSTGPPIEQWA